MGLEGPFPLPPFDSQAEKLGFWLSCEVLQSLECWPLGLGHGVVKVEGLGFRGIESRFVIACSGV